MNVHEIHCYRPMEREFNDWYNSIHLPDVIETPGYVAATRYEIKEFKKGRGTYLTLYEIESDDIDETLRIRLQKAQEEVAAGRGSDLWVNVWPFVLFRRIHRRTNPTPAGTPGSESWVNLVETNAVPGREEAFNAWYNDHLDEVLETPGFVAAARYVIKEPLEGRGKYLAIYEIETDDIEESMRVRRERKAEEVRQGKDPGLWIAVWGSTLFREIFRYPSDTKRT
jgi:hypothetical protein